MKQTELNFDRSNIAGAIRAAHDAVVAAEKAAVKHAADCGRLLATAKETVPHGKWTSWVSDNCSFSMRTAQLYMKLAEYLADGDPAKAQRVAGLSLREVGTILLTKKPEEMDVDSQKKGFGDILMDHWLNGSPLEQRAFITILALQKILPLKSALRWLAKNGNDGSVAANRALADVSVAEENDLDRSRLSGEITFDSEHLLSPKAAKLLFERAGKPASIFASTMLRIHPMQFAAGRA